MTSEGTNYKVSNPYLPNHNYQYIESMKKTTKNIQQSSFLPNISSSGNKQESDVLRSFDKKASKGYDKPILHHINITKTQPFVDQKGIGSYRKEMVHQIMASHNTPPQANLSSVYTEGGSFISHLTSQHSP